MRQEVTRAHKGWALDTVTIHNEVLRQTKEEITLPPVVGAVGELRVEIQVQGEMASADWGCSTVDGQTAAWCARPWVQSSGPQKQTKN